MNRNKKMGRIALLAFALVGLGCFSLGCGGEKIKTIRHDWCANRLHGGQCAKIPKYGYAFCFNHKDSVGAGLQCHAVVDGKRCGETCNPKYIFCLKHKDCWKISPTLPDTFWRDRTASSNVVVSVPGIQTLPYSTCAYNADGGHCDNVPKYGYAYCYTHKDMGKRRSSGGQCHAVVNGQRCPKTCKPAYIFCYEHKDCWKMGPTLTR